MLARRSTRTAESGMLCRLVFPAETVMAEGFLPRDFIETPEGLIFAVVDGRPEAGRVLAFLRYARDAAGACHKLDTQAANRRLAERAPGYLFHSRRLDAPLHGVPIAAIARHYQPGRRVAEILAGAETDGITAKARRWLRLAAGRGLDLTRVGLTGSLLIGAQNPRSDLDFVLYGRGTFHAARRLVRAAIAAGELSAPGLADWRDAHARRGCALSFEDYLWHERRKCDKGMIAGTKFDLGLIAATPPEDAGPARKLGAILLRAHVADAVHAFDYPARYRLDHPEVAEALSFTATYAGQAEAGETVEIAGMLEATASGRRRVVVGSSREAPGEYIRVVRAGECPDRASLKSSG